MEPTLLLVNGAIHTMDRTRPHATALAITGAQIVAVGGDELRALAGPTTRVIDLRGRTVVPGLIDAHLHFLSYGLSLREIDLMNVPSLAVALERIAARAAATPTGHWLTGRGWDQVLWPEPVFPTATQSRRRDAGASGLFAPQMRSRRLGQLAGAQAGRHHRRHTRPGRRRHRARPGQRRAHRHPPRAGHGSGGAVAADPHRRRGGRRRARGHARAHSLGITGIHNMEGAPALRAFQELRRRGEWKLRVLQQIPEVDLDAAIELGIQSGFGDEWIRFGAVKIFADGSLGARSALMVDPYEGEPDNRGIAVSTAEHLNAQVEKAARGGPGRAHPRHRRPGQPQRAGRRRSDAAAPASACTCATASSMPRCCNPPMCRALPSWASSPPCSPSTAPRTSCWPTPTGATAAAWPMPGAAC